MPLVRFEVRNEYGSGLPELYKEADREDPKAVLDGVAVAGLVGILRQLGDLAEFAAEVFHGLQEQVMTTTSRSHKLMVRIHDIEVALPPLEKAVLAQTSHLHFCYAPGSEWHPRIRKENNHFIYNDLPRFIMDSYEECRDPPRLHMLDKFDTGGLGSCLKRYSDPTFFKRVSAISSDTNAERRKEKKARKSKRRRERQKNGDFTRSASILSGSESCRMQFTVPNDYFQPSPAQSQTASYAGATFKSDLPDQSFDSRAESGFIECAFNNTSPTQLAKQDMKESSSSTLNLRSNDNHDSSYSDKIGFRYDVDQSLLQEKAVPDSSYVTWDEKTEIMEHENQNYDSDEASHMPLNDHCRYTEEFIDTTRNRDQTNISLDNEKTDPIIGGSQLEDVESEADNYMDALNTIDTDLETDFDYQTKREVEQCTTNFKSSGIEGNTHENMPHEPDHHPSHLKSHTPPAISLNKDMLIPSIVPSDRVSQDDSPHISGVTSETDSLPVNVISERYRDGSKSDVLSSNYSSHGSKVPHRQDPTSAKVVSNIPAEFSGVHSVNFWTNGGLLGLEPSKPPDFTVSSAVCHNLKSGSADGTTPSCLSAINDCSASRQPDETVGTSRNFSFSTPCHENQEDDSNSGSTSFWKLSRHLSINHGKAGDSPRNKILDQRQRHDLGGDFNTRSTDNNLLNDGVFGLGHRLLVNGFRRKPSVSHDRINETSKLSISGSFENNRGQRTTSEIGNGSSPPLELMKISFEPMKGSVESSKLRLKFHDGSHIHEPARDMFPSFQLVPDPTLPPNADVSDSDDDDTFCRSSPRSHDRMSYHSQSNSEQWESSETPRSIDQEIYGTLSRISSVESIPSSHELGGNRHESILIDNTMESPYAERVVDSSHLVPLFDLLSFDAVEPSQAINSVPEDSSMFSCHKEPAPPPPPLPPMQWRVSKSHPDATKHEDNSVSDDPNHAFDMKELQSPIHVEQPKPDSINPQPVRESYVEQVQGRVLKSPLDMPEQIKKDFVSDGPARAFDLKELQSAIRVARPNPDSVKHQLAIASDVEQVQLDIPFNQPKPEPIKNQQAMAFDMKQLQSAIPRETSVSTPKSKQQEQLKMIGQRATGQAVNGNGIDEQEDFLQQIRTKSFNLRRTSTEKSTVSPVLANVKVSAILEKAIAIRQAVGSDDSEIDTWSDA